MIHLIYIYFIINAFAVGERIMWAKPAFILYLAMFGTAHYFVLFLGLIGYTIKLLLIRYTWIPAFWNLYFSDKYKKENNEIKRESIEKRLKVGSFFEKLFIRQMDKKYNYGLVQDNKK